MKCVICETRKPRRYCPGVRGDICALCCGTERENTIDCPFDCVYLREARSREKPHEVTPEFLAGVPFSDIRIPARFLRENSRTAQMLFAAVVRAILSAPSAIDYDIRDALDALVRTYKTLQSGLVYETRPQNPIAAGIYDAVTAGIEESRKQIAATGGTSLRDADIMTVLLIFQREEYRWNNGRQRGRAYVDHLRELFQGMESLPEPAAASLIV